MNGYIIQFGSTIDKLVNYEDIIEVNLNLTFLVKFRSKRKIDCSDKKNSDIV